MKLFRSGYILRSALCFPGVAPKGRMLVAQDGSPGCNAIFVSRVPEGRREIRLTRLASLALLMLAGLAGCRANAPGAAETRMVDELKRTSIGGKDWKSPVPDTPENAKIGGEHFQHHCMVCHGLDGHNTGVPFAEKMSPPVADLGSQDVQKYSDGQLKWIIQNGIRFTGMPGWQGILEEDEMWHVVAYLRHLPPKGSLGAPAVFKEEEEEHKAMEAGHKPGENTAPSAQPHQHQHEHKH